MFVMRRREDRGNMFLGRIIVMAGDLVGVREVESRFVEEF